MNNLAEIISVEKKIQKINETLLPLMERRDEMKDSFKKLLPEFLEKTMVKGKKYYLNDSHDTKWVCWTTIHREKNPYARYDMLFKCEFRDKRKKSTIFQEFLSAEELYELFIHTDYYKELVRETNIETIVG